MRGQYVVWVCRDAPLLLFPRCGAFIPRSDLFLWSTGVTASHFHAMCKPYAVIPMCDERSGNVGVITTQESKENGVLLMQTALQNNMVRRASEVFSVGLAAWNPSVPTSRVERFDQCVGEAIMQASRFKKLIKEGDAFQKAKIEFSGKDSANQDDLVMSWLIAFYFITKYINRLGD